jgi:hypothetical protein
MSDPKEMKEIDGIVDEVIDDVEKAEQLKKTLHDKLGKNLKPPRRSQDDDDDLWDNVPL